MAQNLFLLVSMVMVCLAPGIHGTSHLMFSNSTQVNATRIGCGTTKVCVDLPAGCDPAVNGNCLFSSLMIGPAAVPNGRVLNITMRGIAEANQYIAIGLTLDASVGTTMLFVCGRVNATVFRFFTRNQNNSNLNASLTPTERRVKNIVGNITGNVLKCEFTVPDVNATQMRSDDATLVVKIGNGTLGTSGPNQLVVQRTTDPLNLADPASTVVARPTAATNNASPTSFISPVSLLLGVLAWPALLRM